MMRKILWIIPVLLLFVAIIAPNAHADTIDYTISGADSGSIAITETGGVITAISGTFDSAMIDALLPAGSIGNNDDDYYSSGPILDGGGISFSLDSADTGGYVDVNLYVAGTSYFTEQGNCPGSLCGFNEDVPDSIALASAVPELNPTTGTSAIVLLACAVLIIRGRRPMPNP